MQTDCSRGHNDGKQRQKRPEFVRRIHELRRKGQAFRQDGVKPVRRIHNLRHQGRKIGRSEPNLFGGGYTHYDANGKKIGSGEPGFFGGYTHYDANGKKIGSSEPGFFGGYTNYDANGHKVGSSEPGLFGGYTSYDANRHKNGSSAPGLFSTPSNGSSKYTASDSGTCSGEGCYIATCVYGSYGAPEVLTLRRFRDEILKKHMLGRMFIRCYYAISPYLVKWFGKSEWFRRFWRKRLDGMVTHLNFRKTEPPRDKPSNTRRTMKGIISARHEG